jgi:hypothetical protein
MKNKNKKKKKKKKAKANLCVCVCVWRGAIDIYILKHGNATAAAAVASAVSRLH